ncbi:hypothetical protein EI94DRAFT_1805833 [Lactarius quietus]|nr:hypothetical protein EI94DRAFT_1805833 [Lactarius quietus]
MSTPSSLNNEHILSSLSSITSTIEEVEPTAADVAAAFRCIEPGDFIPEASDVRGYDTGGLEEDAEEMAEGATPERQSLLVAQTLIKVPSISDISDVVRVCGTYDPSMNASVTTRFPSSLHHQRLDISMLTFPPESSSILPPHGVFTPAPSSVNKKTTLTKKTKIPRRFRDPGMKGYHLLRHTLTEDVEEKAKDKAEAPDGFELNIPPQFIPFRMIVDGHHTITKYVHLKPGNNTIVFRCMKKGGEIEQGDVHAAPDFDTEACDYMHDQLRYLHNDFGGRQWVDLAIAEIPDHTLSAEISRYRHVSQRYDDLHAAITALENEQYMVGNEKCKCIRRLEEANALQRVMDKEVEKKQEAMLGFMAINLHSLPEGAFWGQFNDQLLDKAVVNRLVNSYHKNIQNCTDNTAINIVLKKGWLTDVNNFKMTVEGLNIEDVPKLNCQRQAMQTYVEQKEKEIKKMEKMAKSMEDASVNKKGEGEWKKLMKTIAKERKKLELVKMWVVCVFNRDMIKANEEKLSKALFRFLLWNKVNQWLDVTPEERLLEIINELHDTYEEDLHLMEKTNKKREEDDGIHTLDKFNEKWLAKVEALKDNNNLQHLFTKQLFAHGLVMVLWIQRHYTHAGWFTVKKLNEMLEDHGVVLLWIGTRLQWASGMGSKHYWIQDCCEVALAAVMRDPLLKVTEALSLWRKICHVLFYHLSTSVLQIDTYLMLHPTLHVTQTDLNIFKHLIPANVKGKKKVPVASKTDARLAPDLAAALNFLRLIQSSKDDFLHHYNLLFASMALEFNADHWQGKYAFNADWVFADNIDCDLPTSISCSDLTSLTAVWESARDTDLTASKDPAFDLIRSLESNKYLRSSNLAEVETLAYHLITSLAEIVAKNKAHLDHHAADGGGVDEDFDMTDVPTREYPRKPHSMSEEYFNDLGYTQWGSKLDSQGSHTSWQDHVSHEPPFPPLAQAPSPLSLLDAELPPSSQNLVPPQESDEEDSSSPRRGVATSTTPIKHGRPSVSSAGSPDKESSPSKRTDQVVALPSEAALSTLSQPQPSISGPKDIRKPESAERSNHRVMLCDSA